jgi:hypothetical protein
MSDRFWILDAENEVNRLAEINEALCNNSENNPVVAIVDDNQGIVAYAPVDMAEDIRDAVEHYYEY